MRVKDLNAEERLALVALVDQVVHADGRLSDEEQDVVAFLSGEMGEDAWAVAHDRAAAGLQTREALLDLVDAVRRPDARSLILAMTAMVADADGRAEEEEALLEEVHARWTAPLDDDSSVDELPLGQTGGCTCGEVRYLVDSSRIAAVYCCHCLDCQRQSGSAFAMLAILPADALRITSGEPDEWERFSDTGNVCSLHFCPDCGGPLFDAEEGNALLRLRVGSLDESAGLDPVGHAWIVRARPWVSLGEDTVIFQRQQPGYGAFIDAWKARG